MKLKFIASAVLTAVLSIGVAGSVSASDTASGNQPTIEAKETDDSLSLRFGQNLFLSGLNISDTSATNGIIFSAGNQLSLKNKSEYAFVAGNIIEYSSTTERDLFAAGNVINITKDAKVGRDAFVTGNSVTVSADLPSNFAAAANTVTLRDIKIDGNVDLSVDHVVFEGKVEITGKLSINEDADITGLGNVTYAELEKYEIVEYTITSAEIWVGRLFAISGLFITIAVVMALFPAMDKRVAKELNLMQFGKDLVIGFVTLLGVPFIIIFLLISFFAAPAGLVLLAVYLVMLYLAQGFTGLYLGKVIFEQLFKGKMNRFIEALVGIVLVVLLSMLSPLVSLLTIILGLGLIMQSIKPNRKKSLHKPTTGHPSDEEIEEAEVTTIAQTESKTNSEKSKAKSSTKSKTISEDTSVKEEE